MDGKKGGFPVDKALRKYRDLIVYSAGLEEERKERTIVRVKSVEDLAKISEETAKPIIHERKLAQRIFYVPDGDVRYEFTAEEE